MFWESVASINPQIGKKTETCYIRQMPALYICNNRTPTNISAAWRTSAVQISHRHTVYDNDKKEQAFPADVLMPGTYRVDGRHQPCWRPAPCNILPGRDRLVAGEELLPARLIGARSLLFRKQCGIVRLKEITHGKSYCLSFYTAFNKHKCRKGE